MVLGANSAAPSGFWRELTTCEANSTHSCMTLCSRSHRCSGCYEWMNTTMTIVSSGTRPMCCSCQACSPQSTAEAIEEYVAVVLLHNTSSIRNNCQLSVGTIGTWSTIGSSQANRNNWPHWDMKHSWVKSSQTESERIHILFVSSLFLRQAHWRSYSARTLSNRHGYMQVIRETDRHLDV